MTTTWGGTWGTNGSAGGRGRALHRTVLFLVALLFDSQSLGVVIFAGVGIAVAAAIFAGLRGVPILRPAPVRAAGPDNRSARRRQAARCRNPRVSGSIVLPTVMSLPRSVSLSGILSRMPEHVSSAGSCSRLSTVFEIVHRVAAGSVLVALRLPRPVRVSRVPLFG